MFMTVLSILFTLLDDPGIFVVRPQREMRNFFHDSISNPVTTEVLIGFVQVLSVILVLVLRDPSALNITQAEMGNFVVCHP
jgi:hypothetical protein